MIGKATICASILAAIGIVAGCAGTPRPSSNVEIPSIDRPAPSLTRLPHHEKPITVWFDATANWERLMTREGVAEMMDKCVAAGVDAVVIDVKPISGYVMHNSTIAPKLLEWKGIPHSDPDYDLLAVSIEEGQRRGLKVLASLNIFAEGHIGAEGSNVPRHGTLMDFPERQAWASMDWVVPAGETEPRLVPSMQGVRGHAMFVSAAHPEAIAYQWALLREVAEYPGLDGICLDRCRWSGGTADFSDASRAAFEAHIGTTITNWPHDVYTWKAVETAVQDGSVPDEGERATRGVATTFERVNGPLYPQWLTWRSTAIRDRVNEARELILSVNPDMIVANYTGAWYPVYYSEGLNWASPNYNPAEDYDWAPADYQQTAFAHLLDHLYHGWYYTAVTEEEAEAQGNPWWMSIDGTARLVERVVQGDVPVHGGLYLFQYEDNVELFRRCMRAAYDGSDGLMIFDLIYLEQYGWWDEINRTFPERTRW